MKISIIVTAILLVYGVFSTIFHDTALVGHIGHLVGAFNLKYFGYFAYVDIPLLFIPLFKFYFDASVRKDLDFYLGWTLVFIGGVLFESLVVDIQNAGFVGREIVAFLEPLIGKAGLWLFWLMVVALSVVFIFEEGINLFDFKRYNSASLDQIIHLLSTMFSGSVAFLKEIFIKPFTARSVTEEYKEKASNISDEETTLYDPAPPQTPTIEKKSEQKPLKGKDEIDFEEQVSWEDLYIVESTPDQDTKADEHHEEYMIEMEDIIESVKPKQATHSHPQEKSNIEPKENPVSEPETPNHTTVPIVEELEENSKLLEQIEQGKLAKPKNFTLPKITFLQEAPPVTKRVNETEIDRKIGELLAKLSQFKVEGDVVRTYSGPLVTTFEFKPAPNVKVSKILGLQDDLAMALSAETIRIQAPIPGRNVVGIEIPNESVETIYLREILESDIFKNSSSPLTVALGKDIVGQPFITDIRKLPHLLIAGTTGSGKSVGINAMILSLLYRNDPDHLKLMLIDPKMLEFASYEDIPHLITPVITEPAKAIAALANMVGEMERRYKLMAKARTKNIENYNEKVKLTGDEPFPYIVVIIDELADLMMNGGKEVELSIARLAQKSRACGIHLIVATQRPSVDVVTGLIKANLPSRLSYRVGQRIDSKVILDQVGAESLLGRGDGLFTPPGATGLVRIHAPWNSEEEIEAVVEFLKAQRAPEYDESYLLTEGEKASGGSEGGDLELDPLFEEAKQIVLADKKTSISYLQRKLQIGYNRSANIIEQLEIMGVLSAPNAKGNRDIL